MSEYSHENPNLYPVTLIERDDSIYLFKRYLVVWKKVDGKWYLSSDIFNSDFPKEKGV